MQLFAINYGFHFVGGIKTLINNRITFDISLGLGLKETHVQENNFTHDFKKNVFSHAYSGVYPLASFMIGFQF
jgi:hypothetical protein